MKLWKKITLLFLAMTASACLLTACSGSPTAEEIAIGKGYNTKVTLDLNGGTSNGLGVRYVLLKEDSPLGLPWEYGDKQFIYVPTRTGYVMEGLYYGEKAEDGTVTFGNKWQKADKFTADTTLYVKWVKPFYYSVVNLDTEEVTTEYCEVGAKFSMENSDVNNLGGKDLAIYFKDKNGSAWDPEFVHPDLPDGKTEDNAEAEDFGVTVYKKTYKVVRTASDLTDATKKNYYLVGENGELDCSTLGWWNRLSFSGEIVGNNVVIKNLVINKNNTSNFGTTRGLGVFGKLTNAVIKDVTFENCSLNIKYDQPLKSDEIIKVGFLGVDVENSTIENVTFTNCAVNMTVSEMPVSLTETKPVVTLVYDETNIAWYLLEDGNNTIQNNNGTVAITYERPEEV